MVRMTNSREKILVSACLLGERCRYDGEGKKDESLIKALEDYEVIGFCPECAGGLLTPRPPAEISGDRVVREDKKDVTQAFLSGAEKALALVEKEGIKKAILKSKSPSCGVNEIYDGSFTGKLIRGEGVTAKRLREAGLNVLDENEFLKGQVNG